jgi:phage terminase small subunit
MPKKTDNDLDLNGTEDIPPEPDLVHTQAWLMRNGKTEYLTFQQHRFVAEYLKDHNARQAAIRAGYKHFNGVHSNPYYKKNVRAAIQDELEYQIQSLKINADRLLVETYNIAFAGPKELNQYVKLGIKTSLKDKVSALELLMKQKGMFAEHNKKEIHVTIGDMIKESYRVKPRELQEHRADIALPTIIDHDVVEQVEDE